MDKPSCEDLVVVSSEPVAVHPCRPSPEKILYLSNLDSQQMSRRMMHACFVYKARKEVSGDPARVIREALPKVLAYYYPLAGRLRNTHHGKLQVECTDEGALFIEATAHNDLSVLDDLNDIKPSFKQLCFEHPSHTRIEDMYLLAVQVTRFRCGGFVVVPSTHHSTMDGRGAAQFLTALGELARGHAKPSIEPVWNRDLLKPRDPPCVQFCHTELIDDSTTANQLPTPNAEELVQTTIVLNSSTIERLKQRLAEDCSGLEFTTFEVVAALAWRARTNALQIPPNHTVKVFYAADVRKIFNPPLPQGYYGNGFVIPCAAASAHEVVYGTFSNLVNIVRKSKVLLNDEYLRSMIDFLEIKGDPISVYLSQDNVIITEWRSLGFEKVDFGWGGPSSMSPLQWGGLGNGSAYLPDKNGDGVKVLVCMAKSDLKLFQLEMHLLIKEYAGNSDVENLSNFVVEVCV